MLNAFLSLPISGDLQELKGTCFLFDEYQSSVAFSAKSFYLYRFPHVTFINQYPGPIPWLPQGDSVRRLTLREMHFKINNKKLIKMRHLPMAKGCRAASPWSPLSHIIVSRDWFVRVLAPPPPLPSLHPNKSVIK